MFRLNEVRLELLVMSVYLLWVLDCVTHVLVGKNLSDMFPIRNGLKQGDALSPLLFNLL